MNQFKVFLLTTLFVSKVSFGMERPFTEEDMGKGSSCMTQQEMTFGSFYDLQRAEELFQNSRFEECTPQFERLWSECKNLIAFAYLRNPQLRGYVTNSEVLSEIEVVPATFLGETSVKISKLLGDHHKKAPSKKNTKLLSNGLESYRTISSHQQGGRAFYELSLLEENLDQKLELLKKSALCGEMRACIALNDYKTSLSKEWKQLIIFANLYSQKTRSSGEYEYAIAQKITQYNPEGSIPAAGVSAMYWLTQSAHMGNKKAREEFLSRREETFTSQGKSITDRGHWAEYFAFFLQKAKEGDVGSLSGFAKKLENIKQFPEAYFCYKTAAENAQNSSLELKKIFYRDLGVVYYNGIGTERNFLEAAKWFEKAADLGDFKSTELLVGMAVKGHYLSSWFTEPRVNVPVETHAHRVLLAQSIFNRVITFENDQKIAFLIINQEVEHFPILKALIAQCFEDGTGVDQSYELAAENYQEFMNTYQEKDQSRGVACNDLGCLYHSGDGVPQSYESANMLFEEGMRCDNPHAFYNKAFLYFQGHGEEKTSENDEKYLGLYKYAASKGNLNALFHIGLFYINSSLELANSSPELAREKLELGHDYLKQAASQGDLLSRHNRIIFFLLKQGSSDQTPENVRESLIQNAEAGCIESQISLGSIYLSQEEELGIKTSFEEAQKWLDLARVGALKENKSDYLMLIDALLIRYENSEILEEETLDFMCPLEEKDQTETTIEENVGVFQEKAVKINGKQKKHERNIARSLKRRETFLRNIHSNEVDFGSSHSTQDEKGEIKMLKTSFSEKEQDILERFITAKGTIKPRDLQEILKILGNHGTGLQKTKSGYAGITPEGVTFGGHRTHGTKDVDPGHVEGVKKVVKGLGL